MSRELVLDEASAQVWEALRAGSAELEDVVRRTGLDQSKVMAAAQQARQRGWMDIQEQEREELVPTETAGALLEAGLPERRALELLVEAGGSLPIPEFARLAQERAIAVHEVFRWGSVRGWVRREKAPPQVSLTPEGQAAAQTPDHDEQALSAALRGRLFLDELEERGIDQNRVRRLLAKRSELARIKKRTQRSLELTGEGRLRLEEGIRVAQERSALTPEDLKGDAWRNVVLRPYDVTLPAQRVRPAKAHPLRRVMEQTRRAFLEMGFTEVVSPMAESSFWNFDALFQPQDHPARDMQDTFYMAEPERTELPDPALVERVRATHQDGGDTGSDGWGYQWDPDRARQVVLRTHTTAATIRALASHPEPPFKAFCVGWNYRNETISFKHLPVFHQVDGIIIDREANLSTLLGTLQAFYRKMGFQKVKFKPAFYPYTEPSVDVMVYMPQRGKWIEMGGSGIFRPEVTVPLGCRHPVLAWGLGVERLAMLRLGLDDIRQLFQAGLDHVEEVALCR